MMEFLDDEKVVSKFKIVARILDGELNKSQAARHIGRSWNTINTWVRNYEKDGIFGLKNKPRGKSRSLDGDAKELIIELKWRIEAGAAERSVTCSKAMVSKSTARRYGMFSRLQERTGERGSS